MELNSESLDALTTELAISFRDIRDVFYSGILEQWECKEGDKKPYRTLTPDGSVLIASFQMWHMFDVMDYKREQYMPPSLTQEFTNHMYAKVMVPISHGSSTSPESCDEGILYFYKLREEDENRPYEHFDRKMIEVIFHGTCKVDGLWRSFASLGFNDPLYVRIDIQARINHMVIYLIVATELAIAKVFGDQPFVEERTRKLDDLIKTSSSNRAESDSIPAPEDWIPQKATTEVHFYKNNTASCLTNISSTDNEAADEMLIWACFANQQLNNMGQEAHTLAAILARFQGELASMVHNDGTGPVLLEAHPGPAKKRFVATMKPVSEEVRFALHFMGFGLLGRRLRFYVPTSVLLLLRHLAKRRLDNPVYIDCLEKVAVTCGERVLQGELKMRNGVSLAWENVFAALPRRAKS